MLSAHVPQTSSDWIDLSFLYADTLRILDKILQLTVVVRGRDTSLTVQ